MLSIVANFDQPLHQLDVKNAFLNGNLKEAYMEIPLGLETQGNQNTSLQPQEVIYGLKQSPQAWLDKLTEESKKIGYCQRQANHTLFAKTFPESEVAIIIVYVDDIILIGDYEEVCNLKILLAKGFKTKDLGHLKHFLRMEIAQSRKGISISQCMSQTYLKKFVCSGISQPILPWTIQLNWAKWKAVLCGQRKIP